MSLRWVYLQDDDDVFKVSQPFVYFVGYMSLVLDFVDPNFTCKFDVLYCA